MEQWKGLSGRYSRNNPEGVGGFPWRVSWPIRQSTCSCVVARIAAQNAVFNSICSLAVKNQYGRKTPAACLDRVCCAMTSKDVQVITDKTVVKEACMDCKVLTGSEDGAHPHCPLSNPILHSHALVVQVAVCIQLSCAVQAKVG